MRQMASFETSYGLEMRKVAVQLLGVKSSFTLRFIAVKYWRTRSFLQHCIFTTLASWWICPCSFSLAFYCVRRVDSYLVHLLDLPPASFSADIVQRPLKKQMGGRWYTLSTYVHIESSWPDPTTRWRGDK